MIHVCKFLVRVSAEGETWKYMLRIPDEEEMMISQTVVSSRSLKSYYLGGEGVEVVMPCRKESSCLRERALCRVSRDRMVGVPDSATVQQSRI